jgi:outer membrane protein
MNKKFVISIVLCGTTLYSNNINLSLGVATIYKSAIYKGADNKLILIPSIGINYNNFYIRGLEAGYNIVNSNKNKLSFVIKGRLDGYDSDDSSYLVGMENRKDAIESGFIGKLSTDIGNFYLSSLFDISNTHNGFVVDCDYGYQWNYQKGYISPYVGLEFKSKNISNYYYGVKQNENIIGRDYYEPDSTISSFIGIKTNNFFQDNISIQTDIKLKKFDTKISNSPIVDDKYEFRTIIGVNYRF